MSEFAAGARQDNVGRGIFLALVAILIFATQDAMSKFLVQSVSPFQMTMMRFWAFGAFSVFLALRKGSVRETLRTRQPDVLLIGAERLAHNPPATDPVPQCGGPRDLADLS